MKAKRGGRPRVWNSQPQTSLSRFGEEHQLATVTLPRLRVLDTSGEFDLEESKDAADRAAVIRVVRAGRDAWEQIGRADSFESWKLIGAALAVGKARALRISGAERAWGRSYALQFGKWLREHGFDRMPKSVRSVSIELHENIAAITAWRSTLTQKQRKRLIHPLSNVRAWKAATHTNGKCPQDLKREAAAAWRRFVSCVRLLPPDQATPLWQAVSAEAAASSVI